jgi:hypothetical protein
MKEATLGVLAALLWPGSGLLAQQVPVPPCEGPPHPDASSPGSLLNQLAWVDDESIADWSPPDCTGWEKRPVRALLAAAGRFRLSGDSAVLVERLGRISAMTDIIYWSSTRNRWRKLFDEAHALASPDSDATREDFAATELVANAQVHFWLQENNPTAGVVYRVSIHDRTPNRLVFETVNVTPLQAQLLLYRRTIANPREFRQLYFLQRESDDVWRYYSLARMSGTGTLAGLSEASLRNRAEAVFRHIAELEMTREPPAAR